MKEKICLTLEKWKELQREIKNISNQFDNALDHYFHLHSYSLPIYLDENVKYMKPTIKNKISMRQFLEKYPIMSLSNLLKTIKSFQLSDNYVDYEMVDCFGHKIHQLVFDEEKICEILYEHPVYKNKRYTKTLKLLKSKSV